MVALKSMSGFLNGKRGYVKMMAQIVKKAMAAASGWLKISLGFAILSIPIDLLRGHPILNGLWHDWLVANTGLRWQLLGVVLAVLVVAWLGLTLIFALGYGVAAWLKKQDKVKSSD